MNFYCYYICWYKYFLYDIINNKFVWHFNISHVFIQFHFLKNVRSDTKSIKKIICWNIDFLNHKNKEICMYIFNQTLNYDMLLGLFWIKKKNVWINTKNKWLYIKKSKTKIHQQNKKITIECHPMSVVVYVIWMKKVKKNKNKKTIQCFITNMIDIKKHWRQKKTSIWKKNYSKNIKTSHNYLNLKK